MVKCTAEATGSTAERLDDLVVREWAGHHGLRKLAVLVIWPALAHRLDDAAYFDA